MQKNPPKLFSAEKDAGLRVGGSTAETVAPERPGNQYDLIHSAFFTYGFERTSYSVQLWVSQEVASMLQNHTMPFLRPLSQ